MPAQWRVWIAAAALTAFACKLLLALDTWGTNDVSTWYRFAAWSGYFGVGMYRLLPDFNHPPSMIHVLRALNRIADATGVSFSFWIRLPAILADTGTLFLVWKLLPSRALLLLALAPASIMISGFHGNTDPVMVFFLVLSIYLIERQRSLWLCGVCFGLAMDVKVAPIIVAPVFFFFLRGLLPRVRFFGAAAGVTLVSWYPFVFQDPAAVFHNTLGYQSTGGLWGISRVLRQLSAVIPAVARIEGGYTRYGPYLTLMAIVAAAVWMNRLRRVPGLFSQAGVAFFLFLSLASGFGVQYLAWLVPWVVEFGPLWTAIFYSTSGVLLALVYNYWAGGIPWYFADSTRHEWRGAFDFLQYLCWFSVMAITAAALLRTRRAMPRPLRTRFRFATAGFLLAGLTAGVIMSRGSIPVFNHEPHDVGAIRAAGYVQLSGNLFDAGRFHDSRFTAMQAAALDPRSADAQTMIAAAGSKLNFWDESRRHAGFALNLNEGDQLTRDNLARVMRKEPARAATAGTYAEISSGDYRAGKFAQCLTASRHALLLEQNRSDAWTTMAFCYGKADRWDEAVEAARQAVFFSSHAPSAVAVLAWARDHGPPE